MTFFIDLVLPIVIITKDHWTLAILISIIVILVSTSYIKGIYFLDGAELENVPGENGNKSVSTNKVDKDFDKTKFLPLKWFPQFHRKGGLEFLCHYVEVEISELLVTTTSLALNDLSKICSNCFLKSVCYGLNHEDANEIFVTKLSAKIVKSYEFCLLDDRSETFFVALYLTNHLSISQFQQVEKFNWRKYHKVLYHLVNLLKNKNWKVIKKFHKAEVSFEYYEEKSTILEEHLKIILKDVKSKKHRNIIKQWLNSLNNKTIHFPATCKPKTTTTTFNICQNLLVVDGVIYDRERDPPGQRSHYIPPGDQYQESYRLSTFVKFPLECPVNPRHLATAGFFFTGYKDRVKCFSCGLCVESWSAGDNGRSPVWHRSDCLHAHGGDPSNVPIGGGGLARFLMPSTAQTGPSFSSTPVTAAQQPQSMPTTAHSTPTPRSSFQMSRAPPQQSASIFQIVEFASIPSAAHEHFLKNIDLRKESERIRSFEHFPVEPVTVTIYSLAKSGFFYLGNLDRVQCFSCGGVLRNWNYGDNVNSEHRRHFPHCRLMQNNDPRNVPLTEDQRSSLPSQNPIFSEPPNPTDEEQRDLLRMFPCLYPVNPHMRNEASRVETFDDRWDANNITATTQQIAHAGFFYLGERDRVKCWYCNGGLQNWDPDDEPWTEHAKWFPTCEFLLQRKGPDFVHRMVSLFPNLPRPLLRGPFDVPPQAGEVGAQFGSSARARTPPPQIIDPQEEVRRQREVVDAEMRSDIVKSVIELGFPEDLVRRLVRRRIRQTQMYTSSEDLVSDLTVEMENEMSDSEESSPPTPAGPSTSESMEEESSLQSSSSMRARIRELQDERKCKVCRDKLADIVFVPCGHLCCCENCTKTITKCPMCKMKIEKSIRTFMS